MITFHPAGFVYDVVLLEGTAFASTLVGGCIAAQFKTVRIAKFGGSARTVSRSFALY